MKMNKSFQGTQKEKNKSSNGDILEGFFELIPGFIDERNKNNACSYGRNLLQDIIVNVVEL